MKTIVAAEDCATAIADRRIVIALPLIEECFILTTRLEYSISFRQPNSRHFFALTVQPDLPEPVEFSAQCLAVALGDALHSPDPVSPQQAMLILDQPGQRHEQDPFLRPSGFGGDGEHLRG